MLQAPVALVRPPIQAKVAAAVEENGKEAMSSSKGHHPLHVAPEFDVAAAAVAEAFVFGEEGHTRRTTSALEISREPAPAPLAVSPPPFQDSEEIDESQWVAGRRDAGADGARGASDERPLEELTVLMTFMSLTTPSVPSLLLSLPLYTQSVQQQPPLAYDSKFSKKNDVKLSQSPVKHGV